MKFAVLIPIWKRHDLTNICFEYLAEQRKKFGFDVMVVGSEGDNSEMLTTGHGFDYVEYSNENLGEKLNYGLSRLKKYDAVVVLGSDDFLTYEAWNTYSALDLSGKVYYGFGRLYFYTTKNGKLSEFIYKGANIRTIGAGRIYSKAALKSVDYKLWSDEKNCGLDTDASANLSKTGCKEISLEGYHVLDVKHAENITDHAVARVGKSADVNLIQNRFGRELFESLKELVFIEGTETVTKSRRRARIKNRIMAKESITIKMLVGGGGLMKDQEIMTTAKAARHLLRTGKAVVIAEKSGVVIEKKVPCKKCDENKNPDEKCIPCEKKEAEKLNSNTTENGKNRIQNPVETGTTGKGGKRKGGKN